jgi:integrase
MQRGLAENNPVIGTETNEEKSRDRVLTPAEFRLIWNALEDDQYGACIKLLALTGQRLNEIGRLRRSEIHDGQIILPPERTKNAKPHVLPLSGAAAAIIAQQPKGAGDLIFGNGDSAAGAVVAAGSVRDKQRSRFGTSDSHPSTQRRSRMNGPLQAGPFSAKRFRLSLSSAFP